jgi:chaperonin GroEL (HSP60 family)
MPKKKENAKIALLDSALEIEKTEMSAEIRIRDPSQMKAFLDQESSMLEKMVSRSKLQARMLSSARKASTIWFNTS